jgi:uncharacterized protein YjbI with pentapeptide repeats
MRRVKRVWQRSASRGLEIFPGGDIMRRLARYIPITAVILVAVSLLIWQGYSRGWTGFSAYIDSTGIYHPAKTLWDWIGLVGGLLIPILLAIIGRQLTTQQARIADDRARETTLQNYFDKMTELLLENDLRTSTPGSEVQDIARARTVTTLRQLDRARRNILLRFLAQAGLIGGEDARVRQLDTTHRNILLRFLAQAGLIGGEDARVQLLSGAHLSQADLSGAHLSGADLRGADLSGADLSGAILWQAHLSGADLRGADLSGADLGGAILWQAHLSGADLRGAYLFKAFLRGAFLRGANLSGADLRRAFLRTADLRGANLREANLRGADLARAELHGITYDDNTTWPDNFTPPPSTTTKE